MRRIIRQTTHLPAPPEDLFAMYLDPAQHEAFTGAPVVIADAPGAEFKAFNGLLWGTVLEVIKPTLVVLSWRSVNFYDDDPDSTLILSFSKYADGGTVELIHLDVPEQDFDGVTQGWHTHYWKPWKEYLERH